MSPFRVQCAVYSCYLETFAYARAIESLPTGAKQYTTVHGPADV